jgi:hypothetical protein
MEMDKLIERLRYMGNMYQTGQQARGGSGGKHYLMEAAEELERMQTELLNIANAKRFDRSVFEDDTVFADWAQARCRYVGRGDAAADAAHKAGMLARIDAALGPNVRANLPP